MGVESAASVMHALRGNTTGMVNPEAPGFEISRELAEGS
jgi:hypothetical protein